MIAKRDNKHRAVELLKSIFENNFYSQDERRMLSSMGAESTIHSTPANIIERILFYKFSSVHDKKICHAGAGGQPFLI
jgi:hypothetical protein